MLTSIRRKLLWLVVLAVGGGLARPASGYVDYAPTHGQLIKDSNISLCFAGHDHNMQHLRVEGYNTSFVVSGAGGASLYEIKRTERGFTDEKHLGFNYIHVTSKETNVQFINTKGDCLHHFQRTPAGDVKVLS